MAHTSRSAHRHSIYTFVPVLQSWYARFPNSFIADPCAGKGSWNLTFPLQFRMAWTQKSLRRTLKLLPDSKKKHTQSPKYSSKVKPEEAHDMLCWKLWFRLSAACLDTHMLMILRPSHFQLQQAQDESYSARIYRTLSCWTNWCTTQQVCSH